MRFPRFTAATVLLSALTAVPLAPAVAQAAAEICPDRIDSPCVAAVADRVIAALPPDLQSARSSLSGQMADQGDLDRARAALAKADPSQDFYWPSATGLFAAERRAGNTEAAEDLGRRILDALLSGGVSARLQGNLLAGLAETVARQP